MTPIKFQSKWNEIYLNHFLRNNIYLVTLFGRILVRFEIVALIVWNCVTVTVSVLFFFTQNGFNLLKVFYDP